MLYGSPVLGAVPQTGDALPFQDRASLTVDLATNRNGSTFGRNLL